MGKHMLLTQFRTAVTERLGDSARVLHSTCTPLESTIPYFQIRQVLHQLVGLNGGENPSECVSALKQALSTCGPGEDYSCVLHNLYPELPQSPHTNNNNERVASFGPHHKH